MVRGASVLTSAVEATEPGLVEAPPCPEPTMGRRSGICRSILTLLPMSTPSKLSVILTSAASTAGVLWNAVLPHSYSIYVDAACTTTHDRGSGTREKSGVCTQADRTSSFETGTRLDAVCRKATEGVAAVFFSRPDTGVALSSSRFSRTQVRSLSMQGYHWTSAHWPNYKGSVGAACVCVSFVVQSSVRAPPGARSSAIAHGLRANALSPSSLQATERGRRVTSSAPRALSRVSRTERSRRTPVRAGSGTRRRRPRPCRRTGSSVCRGLRAGQGMQTAPAGWPKSALLPWARAVGIGQVLGSRTRLRWLVRTLMKKPM